MKCIILASGLGTRMGELTKKTPKAMLIINNKPKLAWSIEMLPREIEEVILVVGYLKEQIIDFFGLEFNNRKIHYVEQRELNGTAGAVALAQDFIDGKVLAIMGDDLYDREDLRKLLEYEQSLLAYKTNNAKRFGLVDMDSDNNLIAVVERPHDKNKGLVNAGAYVLSKEYFNTSMVKISEKEYGPPQTIVSMYPKNKTHIVTTNKWQSIGSPKDLEIAQKRIDEFI